MRSLSALYLEFQNGPLRWSITPVELLNSISVHFGIGSGEAFPTNRTHNASPCKNRGTTAIASYAYSHFYSPPSFGADRCDSYGDCEISTWGARAVT